MRIRPFLLMVAVLVLGGGILAPKVSWAIPELTGNCFCSDKPTVVMAGGGCVRKVQCEIPANQTPETGALGTAITNCRAGGNTTVWQQSVNCPVVGAATAPTTQSAQQILASANPLNKCGPNNNQPCTLNQAIGRFINLFTGLVGSFSLLMFVYGGFIYLTAGGSDEKVKKAKEVFKWTTIGLVTVFGSYAVVNGFFVQLNTSFGTLQGRYPEIYPLGQIAPEIFVGRIIRFLLGIAGVVSLLMFLWGGWNYFASQGEPKMVEAGKKTIINAVIGMVLIFTAYAITNFIIGVIATGLNG